MYIKLKKAKEKAVLNFHPWIFSGAIHEVEKGIKSGDTVKVLSHEGQFLAYGHFDPSSQIRVRCFSYLENESDETPEFWLKRWREIYKRKIDSFIDTENTGFRFLYSEGDMSPGFIVDCYDQSAVFFCRTPGSIRHKQTLVSLLIELGFNNILEKESKNESDEVINAIFHKGHDKKVVFVEHGLRYYSDLEFGQKTGFFLDQRENRKLLGSYAKGKIVLNAFAYSGAFSVCALKNKAKMIHSLDISSQAIALTEENLSLNFDQTFIESKHKSIVKDCFVFLKEMKMDEYDLIILDPPAFTKNISTVNQAARGYKEINMKAISKIRKGGIIFTFSCSQHISSDLFRKIIFGAAKDTGRPVKVLHQMSQASDHAFSIYHPEGEYLKGLVIQVD